MDKKLYINEIEAVNCYIEDSKIPDMQTLRFEQNGRSMYLLSKYNPMGNINETLENIDRGNAETVWILIGFKLGYEYEALRKLLGENIKIIIIEPNEVFLKQQLSVRNTREIIEEDKNLIIVSGYEKIDKIINVFSANIDESKIYNCRILKNECYLQIYPYTIKWILQQFYSQQQRNHCEINTRNYFMGLIEKNLLKNLPYIQKGYDITKQFGKYCNKPAVIVSAGPSLEKNIQYLKDFKGLIFTGGRTLSAVCNLGVSPDFVVTVDPGDRMFEVFGEYQKNKFPLVSMANGNTDVIKNNTGPQYFVGGTQERLAVKDLLDREIPGLPGGGSIATYAFSLAHYLGCNPIILIGQDLAYTNQKTHATSCHGNSVNSNEKLFPRKGYYGDTVYTTFVLDIFRGWFEEYIKCNPDITAINATEGGADIAGTIKKTFKEVVEEYGMKEHPKVIHEKYEQTVERDTEDIFDATEKELTIICKLMKDAKKECAKLEKEFLIYKGKRIDNIDKLVKKLDNIDEQARKTNCLNLLDNIFQVIYRKLGGMEKYDEAIGEKGVKQGIRIAQKNTLIYEAKYEAAREYLKILKEVRMEL